MEPRHEQREQQQPQAPAQPQQPRPKRFRLVRLEERIAPSAPGNLRVSVHGVAACSSDGYC
jgi:hypothetical protein